jgi:hypothetical protein
MRQNETWTRSEAEDAARQAEAAIRGRGAYDHVHVRAHGRHLVVETDTPEGPWPVARLTHLPTGEFGISFRRHTGKWEPMPFAGPLAKVVADLCDTLASYLARDEHPLDTCETDH